MKRTLLTVLLFTIIHFSYSQDYIPMLQEGNSWNVVTYDGFTGNAYTHTFQVNGEEIINDITYYNIDGGYCKFREENGKVYGYEPGDGQEYLIYDFSLEIGEVVDLTYNGNDCRLIHDTYVESMTVVNKSIQFIAGQDRRVLEFEDSGISIDTWIEGVGSLFGFHPNGNGFDSNSELTCFTHQGIINYFNDYNECIILGVEDFELSEVVLHPNPVTNTSTLQLPQEGSIDLVKVYDMTGRLVKEISTDSDHVTIHGSEYTSGLYFYQLFSQGGFIATQRFIVN